MPAAPSELESLRYIEEQLKGYGFATELILHDAYISLPGKAQVVHGGRTLPCITHSFSRPSPAGGLTAPAVSCRSRRRRRISPASDVRGKIVVVDGIANPGRLAPRHARRGGRASFMSARTSMCTRCASRPVWGSPTHETIADLPRTVVVTVAHASRATRSATALQRARPSA